MPCGLRSSSPTSRRMSARSCGSPPASVLPSTSIEPCGFPFDDRALRRAGMDYARRCRAAPPRSWDGLSRRRARRGRLVLLTTKASMPHIDVRVRGRRRRCCSAAKARGVPDEVHEPADAAAADPACGRASARSTSRSPRASSLGEALRQTGWADRTRVDDRLIRADDEEPRPRDWFESLRDRICAAFEAIEDELSGSDRRPAGRDGSSARLAAADRRRRRRRRRHEAMMKGRVFEKVGRQRLDRHGDLQPGIRQADPRRGRGSALLRHRHHPGRAHGHAARAGGPHEHAPSSPPRRWFGGGADLNPMIPERSEDTADFHAALQAAPATAHDPTTTRASRNGATSISSCRTAATRAASAASSTTISKRRLGQATSPSPATSARRSSTSSRASCAGAWTATGPTSERRAPADPARPLCRVQPALRPRHPVRPEDRRQCRRDPDVAAAGSAVAVSAAA